jgi:hypothetical protein
MCQQTIPAQTSEANQIDYGKFITVRLIQHFVIILHLFVFRCCISSSTDLGDG